MNEHTKPQSISQQADELEEHMMHELERRQAKRAGVAIAPPAVMDATIEVTASASRLTNDDESSIELINEPIDRSDVDLRNEPIPSDGPGN